METQGIEWKRLLGRIAMSLTLVLALSFFYKLVTVRLRFYRLKKQGLPMPPWDPIFGNLRALAALAKKLPKDAQQAHSFAVLACESPGLDACFYVDVWPFGFPILAVTSAEIAIEACQKNNLPKPDALVPLVDPMTGGRTFFDLNGPEWKRTRDLFSHGFSMQVVMGRLPTIIEEAQVYVDVLRQHAKTGDTFSLEDATCNYVIDIIGRIALNTHFRSQRGFNPVAAAMRDTIEWESQIETGNLLSRLSPMRFYKQWRNGRAMNLHIGLELEKRYQEWKQKGQGSRSKAIIDLVLAESMKTRKQAGPMMDPEFKSWATKQMRLFIFVGHDSTAITIVYSLHLLSKHPDALARVRAEHDEVFGPDPSTATELLKQRPELINRLPYTLAVIKETLRLYPPANGIREGLPNLSLRDKNGREYPTEGFAIWTVHSAIHRNSNHWPDPHAFIPDRWLVEVGHPLYPPPGAWRPFEQGPRDCIGQNLALLDIKVTLAMTAREFDFHDQYAEWDRQNPAHGLNTMFGDRAYLVQKGSGRPAQGLPCTVSLRGAQ